jgi:predicted nucleic acid-binding protein
LSYLLDTTFLIDYLRNREPAVTRFARLFAVADPVFVTEIGVCEVAAGIRPEDTSALAALLEPLEFVQPGPHVAVMAGQWRYRALKRGATLSLPDALIAAAAFDLDAAVLTRNLRDFALTPARIETY